MIGLQALRAALDRSALPGPPVLFRLPGLPVVVQGAYEAAADFCEVRELPWTDETPERPFPPAAGFARVLDMRDFAFDPAFRGVAMIDFFLTRLGLDPASLPAAQRRNAWLAPRMPALAPAGLPRRYALLCPKTSMTLRDMPDLVRAMLTNALAVAGWQVVDQSTLPPAESFAALCGLVAGAALMISADTAMPHLADAFAVPCLAFFTTHRPEWRVRDYPLCRAVHLPGTLPEALEFSRGPQDEAAAQAAWFAHGGDLRPVRQAVAEWLQTV